MFKMFELESELDGKLCAELGEMFPERKHRERVKAQLADGARGGCGLL
jgi:hypothetical protein